jgi:perosamine synthetase
LPMFKSIPENTNSYSIPNRAINLPSYHDMLESDLIRVAQCIKDIINES